MFKRTLKLVTAAAVLASTLVTSALPAYAATYTTGSNANEATVQGGEQWTYGAGGGVLDGVNISFDPGAFGTAYGNDRAQGARQAPGGSATLTLSWDWGDDYPGTGHGCGANGGLPTSATVKIMAPGGLQIGSTPWTYTFPTPNSPNLYDNCYGSATKTVYFDSDPLGSTRGSPLSVGAYELYVSVSGGALGGIDSRGAHGAGPSNWEYTQTGIVGVGEKMDVGFTTKNGDPTDLQDLESDMSGHSTTGTGSTDGSTTISTTGAFFFRADLNNGASDVGYQIVAYNSSGVPTGIPANSNITITAVTDSTHATISGPATGTYSGLTFKIQHQTSNYRYFKGSFGRICGTTDTAGSQCTNNSNPQKLMNDGKALVFSTPPVGDGVTWTGGSSPWAQTNAQLTAIIGGNTTNDAYKLLKDLEYLANLYSVPAYFAIQHEPHNKASDTSKGWNNGASTRKCGTATDPAANDPGPPALPACNGSSSDYRTMYQNLMTVVHTKLALPHVNVAYIAVPSNMTPGTPVGASDNMRPEHGTSPVVEDYDFLGGDPYNYGCFGVTNCTDTAHGGNNKWKSFEQQVDDPSSSNTLLKLAAAKSKKVIIAEVGSHPGCNGTETANGCNGSSTSDSTWWRDLWFKDMNHFLLTSPRAIQYITGFMYYHTLQTYNWRFLATTQYTADSRGQYEWMLYASCGNCYFLGAAYSMTPVTHNLTP